MKPTGSGNAHPNKSDGSGGLHHWWPQQAPTATYIKTLPLPLAPPRSTPRSFLGGTLSGASSQTLAPPTQLLSHYSWPGRLPPSRPTCGALTACATLQPPTLTCSPGTTQSCIAVRTLSSRDNRSHPSKPSLVLVPSSSKWDSPHKHLHRRHGSLPERPNACVRPPLRGFGRIRPAFLNLPTRPPQHVTLRSWPWRFCPSRWASGPRKRPGFDYATLTARWNALYASGRLKPPGTPVCDRPLLEYPFSWALYLLWFMRKEGFEGLYPPIFISPASLHKAFRNLRKGTSLDGFGWHSWRRGCARSMWHAGASADNICTWCRWSSGEMAHWYVGHTPRDKSPHSSWHLPLPPLDISKRVDSFLVFQPLAFWPANLLGNAPGVIPNTRKPCKRSRRSDTGHPTSPTHGATVSGHTGTPVDYSLPLAPLAPDHPKAPLA